MKKVEGRKPSFSSAESAEGENERSSKPAGMLGRDQSSSSVSSNSRVPSREKGTGLRVLRKTSEKSTSVKKSKQEREKKVDRRTSIPDTGSSRAEISSKLENDGNEIEETVKHSAGAEVSTENSRMDAMFDNVFNGLRHSLSSIISESNLVNRRAEPDPELEKTRKEIEIKLRKDMLYKIKQDASKRLEHIRMLGETNIKHLRHEKERIETEQKILQEEIIQEENTAKVRMESINRRLNLQVHSAERRMRELVFEVIGEYGKCELRMRRRKEFLRYTSTMLHIWKIMEMQWDRFAARLIFEACVSYLPTEWGAVKANSSLQPPRNGLYFGSKSNLRYKVLCRVDDAAELSLLDAQTASFLANLTPPPPPAWSSEDETSRTAKKFTDKFVVTASVRFTKPSPTSAAALKASQDPLIFLSQPAVADSGAQLLYFRAVLRAWYRNEAIPSPPLTPAEYKPSLVPPNLGAGADLGEQEQERRIAAAGVHSEVTLPLMLNAADIEWLQPASYHPALWDAISGNRGIYKDIARKRRGETTSSGENVVQEGDHKEPQEGGQHCQYRTLTDGHLQLRRLLSSFSPQFGGLLASGSVYMCLEEWGASSVQAKSQAKACKDGLDKFYSEISEYYCDQGDALARKNAPLVKPISVRVSDYSDPNPGHPGSPATRVKQQSKEVRIAKLENVEQVRLQLSKPVLTECFLGAHRQHVRSIQYSDHQNTDTKNYIFDGSTARPMGPEEMTPEEEVRQDTHMHWQALAHMYPDAIRASALKTSTLPDGHNGFSFADLKTETGGSESSGGGGSIPLHFLPASTYNLQETRAYHERESRGGGKNDHTRSYRLDTLYVCIRTDVEHWGVDGKGRIYRYPGDAYSVDDSSGARKKGAPTAPSLHRRSRNSTVSPGRAKEEKGSKGDKHEEEEEEEEEDEDEDEEEEEEEDEEEDDEQADEEEEEGEVGEGAEREEQDEKDEGDAGAETTVKGRNLLDGEATMPDDRSVEMRAQSKSGVVQNMKKRGMRRGGRKTLSKGNAAHKSYRLGKSDQTVPQNTIKKPLMLMVPLSDVCMAALIEHMQTENPTVFRWEAGSGSAEESSEKPQRPLVPPNSFVHLLPDHARMRTDFTCTDKVRDPALNPLRHRYLLMADPRGTDAGAGTGSGPRDSRADQSVYLVQIALQHASDVGTQEEVNSETVEGEAASAKDRGGKSFGVGLDDVPNLDSILEAISSTTSPRGYAAYSHDLDNNVISTIVAARSPTFGIYTPGSTAKKKRSDALEAHGEEELPTVPGTSAVSSMSRGSGIASGAQDPTEGMVGAAQGNPPLPSSNSSAKKTPRKWDQSILSSVCRWRACLCEVDTSEDGTIIEGVDSGKSINSNPNARYLCSYHAKVCRYLDNAYLKDVKARGGSKAKVDVASESESAKYLPRKTPPLSLGDLSNLPDSERDLAVVRATSSLINELWDGKLKTTLRTFTKKVTMDMSLRRYMELFANNLFSRLTPREQKLLLGIADGSIVLPKGGEDPATMPTKQKIDVDKMDRKSATAVAKEAKNKRIEYLQSVTDAKALVASLGEDIVVLLRSGVALGPPPPPSWAIWKNKENLTKVLTSQATVQAAREGIMRVETAITEELRKLMDLRVFPGNELSIIKKEVKAHRAAHASIIEKLAKLEAAKNKHGKAKNRAIRLDDEGKDGLDDTSATAVLYLRHADEYVAMVGAEYKLCERKLSLLRAKRMDEAAAQAQQERRREKRRQREEEQRQDPANFGFR